VGRFCLLVCVGGLLVASCADDEETRLAKCRRYRDHLVDLRLADMPAASTDEVRSDHRAALTLALGDTFLATCEQSVSSRALDCGLASNAIAAAMACAEQ